jgi:uncharacterized membrane protein YgdD (TMEM256/DUF423 family)
MERIWLIFAALNGLLGVALGAYGAHGLTAPPERLEIYRTAVAYQMWHALALVGVAVLRARTPAMTLDIAGALFVAGIVLFSGSLYAIVLAGGAPFNLAPPIGGLALMAGWAALAVFAVMWR